MYIFSILNVPITQKLYIVDTSDGFNRFGMKKTFRKCLLFIKKIGFQVITGVFLILKMYCCFAGFCRPAEISKFDHFESVSVSARRDQMTQFNYHRIVKCLQILSMYYDPYIIPRGFVSGPFLRGSFWPLMAQVHLWD